MSSNRMPPVGTTTYTPEMDDFILEKHAEKVSWSDIAVLFNERFHSDGQGARKSGALQVRQQRLKGRVEYLDASDEDTKTQHVTGNKSSSKAGTKLPKAAHKRQREADSFESEEANIEDHQSSSKSPIATRSRTAPKRCITLKLTTRDRSSNKSPVQISSSDSDSCTSVSPTDWPRMAGKTKASAKSRDTKGKKVSVQATDINREEREKPQQSKSHFASRARKHGNQTSLAADLGEDTTEEESSGSDHPDEVWLEYVRSARLDKNAPRQPPLRPRSPSDFDGFPAGRYVIDPLSPILINNPLVPSSFLDNWNWDRRTLLFVFDKNGESSFITRAHRPGDPMFSRPSELLAREQANEETKKRREREQARLACLQPIRSDVYGNTWVVNDRDEVPSLKPPHPPKFIQNIWSTDGFFQLPSPNVSAMRSTLPENERGTGGHYSRKRQCSSPSTPRQLQLDPEPLSPPPNAKVIIGNKVVEWFTDEEMAAMAEEDKQG